MMKSRPQLAVLMRMAMSPSGLVGMKQSITLRNPPGNASPMKRFFMPPVGSAQVFYPIPWKILF